MTFSMKFSKSFPFTGEGSACLIRAIEPLEEYETMQKLRRKSRKKSTASSSKIFKFHELTNGPGKLCMAFDVSRDSCDKLDLATSNEMWLEESEDSRFNQKENVEIVAAKRIGIDRAPAKARDQLWRFYVKNNLFVSTAKPSKLEKNSQSVNEDQ